MKSLGKDLREELNTKYPIDWKLTLSGLMEWWERRGGPSLGDRLRDARTIAIEQGKNILRAQRRVMVQYCWQGRGEGDEMWVREQYPEFFRDGEDHWFRAALDRRERIEEKEQQKVKAREERRKKEDEKRRALKREVNKEVNEEMKQLNLDEYSEKEIGKIKGKLRRDITKEMEKRLKRREAENK